MIKEKEYLPASGWGKLVTVLSLIVAGLGLFIFGLLVAETVSPWLGVPLIIVGCLAGPVAFITMLGFLAIAPNESRVLLLFGDYKGTVRKSGFFWVNPFFTKRKLSLRVRNFETGSSYSGDFKSSMGQAVNTLVEQTSLGRGRRTGGKPSKVNDRDGNPIDISAVVVWKVTDTAEALFEVDDFEHYVEVQSEAALRVLASRHPYDSEDHEVSLRGNTAEVCDQLRVDIQERLDKAGVEVIEARISHLAYSAEIAAAMLQRQQAQAVVAARTKIVEGAVGMVDMALQHLERDRIVKFDDDKKAAMVSNLLVVLCSDRHTQPVVNTGTNYN